MLLVGYSPGAYQKTDSKLILFCVSTKGCWCGVGKSIIAITANAIIKGIPTIRIRLFELSIFKIRDLFLKKRRVD